MIRNLKIRTKLLMSFGLLVSLLIIVGYTSISTNQRLKASATLSNDVAELLRLVANAENLLGDVANSESLNELKAVETALKQNEEREKILTEKIRSQSLSATFSNNVQQILEKEEEIEKFFKSIKELHKEELSSEAIFHEQYPIEKQQRYDIRAPLFAVGSRQLTEDIGSMQYYSKETLYQHKDQKHLDEWLGSIATVKSQVVDPLLRAELDDYFETARIMGEIVIRNEEIKQQEAENFAQARNIIADMQVLALSLEESRASLLTETLEANKRATNALVGIMFVALLLALLLSLFISQLIAKSVSEARNAAVEIARGNMDVEIDTSGKDEIAELSQAIDQMRRSLKVVMEEYEKKIK